MFVSGCVYCHVHVRVCPLCVVIDVCGHPFLCALCISVCVQFGFVMYVSWFVLCLCVVCVIVFAIVCICSWRPCLSGVSSWCFVVFLYVFVHVFVMCCCLYVSLHVCLCFLLCDRVC